MTLLGLLSYGELIREKILESTEVNSKYSTSVRGMLQLVERMYSVFEDEKGCVLRSDVEEVGSKLGEVRRIPRAPGRAPPPYGAAPAPAPSTAPRPPTGLRAGGTGAGRGRAV